MYMIRIYGTMFVKNTFTDTENINEAKTFENSKLAESYMKSYCPKGYAEVIEVSS